MSNDPTKPTDRWDIGKSNLLYNLAFLLLVMTVSHLFDLLFYFKGSFLILEESVQRLHKWSIKWAIQLSSCVPSSPFQSSLRGDNV